MVTRYSWVLVYEIFPNVTWDGAYRTYAASLCCVLHVSLLQQRFVCLFVFTGSSSLSGGGAVPDVTIKNKV